MRCSSARMIIASSSKVMSSGRASGVGMATAAGLAEGAPNLVFDALFLLVGMMALHHLSEVVCVAGEMVEFAAPRDLDVGIVGSAYTSLPIIIVITMAYTSLICV